VPLDLPANGRPGAGPHHIDIFIDIFSRRRYFFRKRLRVFQISDLELGVHNAELSALLPLYFHKSRARRI
jgi:hypothetical protein